MNKKYTNFFRSRQRNGIIEVYRFLLISIVFICHFFLDKSILGKVNSDIYLSQIFNGGICVVAFTIVSGYFLKNNTKYRWTAVTMIVVYSLFLFLLTLILYFSLNQRHETILEWIKNSLFFSNDYAWWYIYIYAIILMISPLINKFLSQVNKWWTLGLIIVMISMNTLIFKPFNYNFILSQKDFIRVLIGYMIGVWIGFYIKLKQVRTLTISLGSFILLFIPYLLYNWGENPIIPHDNWFVENIIQFNNDVAFFRMYIPMSITIFVLSASQFLANKIEKLKIDYFFNYLGEISVPFFLIHEVLIISLCYIEPKFNGFSNCAFFIIYFISFSISAFFAKPLNVLISTINSYYSKSSAKVIQ